MMKPTSAFIIFLVAIGFFSCRSAVISTNHLDRVLASKTLRVGTTGDYRPFTYLDQHDRYVGIDIDMAHDLASSLEAKVTFVPTTWSTLVQDLEAGKFDIAMGGISKRLIRQQSGLFSQSYSTSGKTPIVRCEDTQKYNALERIDQPGVRVVVNPGGTNQAFVKDFIKNAQVITHPDNNTIFEEIAAGRADVMITDSDEVRLQSNLQKELCPAMPGQTFNKFEKGYLLPRDLIWKAYVDEWLQMRRVEGKIDALFEQHFKL